MALLNPTTSLCQVNVRQLLSWDRDAIPYQYCAYSQANHWIFQSKVHWRGWLTSSTICFLSHWIFKHSWDTTRQLHCTAILVLLRNIHFYHVPLPHQQMVLITNTTCQSRIMKTLKGDTREQTKTFQKQSSMKVDLCRWVLEANSFAPPLGRQASFKPMVLQGRKASLCLCIKELKKPCTFLSCTQQSSMQ